jgi:hypothetical protein
MRGPANNDAVRLLIAGRALPTRVRRRVGPELYLDALREGDEEFTPAIDDVLTLRFEDDLSYWAQQVRVSEIMDPIPVIVVQLMGEPAEIEVRAAPRARVGVPVEYALVKPGAPSYTTTTVDLSASGLRFPCAFQPWIGLDLKLSLKIDREDVPLLGRVVRVGAVTEMRGRPAWMTAVQFVAPSPSARNRISALVLRMLAQQDAKRNREPQRLAASDGPGPTTLPSDGRTP